MQVEQPSETCTPANRQRAKASVRTELRRCLNELGFQWNNHFYNPVKFDSMEQNNCILKTSGGNFRAVNLSCIHHMLLTHGINWEVINCLNKACRRYKSRCIHFYLYLYIHVMHNKMMMMRSKVYNVFGFYHLQLMKSSTHHMVEELQLQERTNRVEMKHL